MKKNSKKNTAVKAVIVCAILTVGVWMFLYSYANSYNRLTNEKIVPAVVKSDESGMELELIGKGYRLDTDCFKSESKLYFILYLIVPIESRPFFIGL